MGTEFSIDSLIDELDYTFAWKITHWVSKKEVIRVTRKLYGGKISKKSREYTVSFCRPNYREREYEKRNKGFYESSGHWVQFPPKGRGKK